MPSPILLNTRFVSIVFEKNHPIPMRKRVFRAASFGVSFEHTPKPFSPTILAQTFLNSMAKSLHSSTGNAVVHTRLTGSVE